MKEVMVAKKLFYTSIKCDSAIIIEHNKQYCGQSPDTALISLLTPALDMAWMCYIESRNLKPDNSCSIASILAVNFPRLDAPSLPPWTPSRASVPACDGVRECSTYGEDEMWCAGERQLRGGKAARLGWREEQRRF